MPSLPRERRTIVKSLRSLRRSVRTSHTEEQEPAIVLENVIPTLSEGSELSHCMGDRHTDSRKDEKSDEEVDPI